MSKYGIGGREGMENIIKVLQTVAKSRTQK
jgi:hypothetical protein